MHTKGFILDNSITKYIFKFHAALYRKITLRFIKLYFLAIDMISNLKQ